MWQVVDKIKKGTITSTGQIQIEKKFDFDIRAHVDFLLPNYHEKWVWFNFGESWNFSPLYIHEMREYDYKEFKEVIPNLNYMALQENAKLEKRGNNYFLECENKSLNQDFIDNLFYNHLYATKIFNAVGEKELKEIIKRMGKGKIRDFFESVKSELPEKSFILFFSKYHNHNIILEMDNVLNFIVFMENKRIKDIVKRVNPVRVCY